MKKILITGAGSFIGTNFEKYMSRWPEKYQVDTVDMVDGSWREKSFAGYDSIYHVAGIAHSDVGNVSDERKAFYYKINTDLTIETAKKAKADGVKQFIFMSSAIVYGDNAPIGQKKRITRDTPVAPANFYGDSKVKAEEGILPLNDDCFKVCVLRPPMIYGPGSKGNYPVLAKFAQKLPVFPYVENERSILYVENLMEFVRLMVENEESGIFWPQNSEYVKTCDMVKAIAAAHGKKIRLVKAMKPAVLLGGKVPGKAGGLVNKAFGSMTYDQEMSEYKGIDYRVVSLKESIERTEGKGKKKHRALILASVASMIDQFNLDNINILLNERYEVDVVANFNEPGNISTERANELKKLLSLQGVTIYQVQIPRSLSHSSDIVVSYRMVKKLCDERHYEIVHCHSPIGGVIARLAAKNIHKSGCKVIYTAHGFHFYDGAPKKNWMLFYPIEKCCSRLTDVLITINEEDYRRARDKFYAPTVIRIPGVGVDTDKYRPFMNVAEKNKKRREIGVPEDAIMILSVGELNDNKNHQLVLRTVAEIGDRQLHYVLVGVGKNHDMLEDLAKKLEIESHVHFIGYRADIAQLNNCTDIFAFASKREGLGMAALEALACGVPIIGMNTRGIREYVMDGITGYLFEDNVNSCKSALRKLLSVLDKDGEELRENCRNTAMKYSISMTHQIMETVYTECKKQFSKLN